MIGRDKLYCEMCVMYRMYILDYIELFIVVVCCNLILLHPLLCEHNGHVSPDNELLHCTMNVCFGVSCLLLQSYWTERRVKTCIDSVKVLVVNRSSINILTNVW